MPAAERLGEYFSQEVSQRIGATVRALEVSNGGQKALSDALDNSASKVLTKLLFAVRDEAGAEVFRRCVLAMEGVIARD